MKSNLIAASMLVFLSMFLVPRTSGVVGMRPGMENWAAAGPQGTGQQSSDDLDPFRAEAEEGIKHVLVSQIEAWNRKDLKGFMDGYWHAPDLTFFSGGNVFKGWAAALQRYQQNYQSNGKQMGKLDFQDLNIDLLGKQAAMVTGSWHLTMPDGKQPHGLFTLIFKKMQGGWKIVHDHTSSAE